MYQVLEIIRSLQPPNKLLSFTVFILTDEETFKTQNVQMSCPSYSTYMATSGCWSQNPGSSYAPNHLSCCYHGSSLLKSAAAPHSLQHKSQSHQHGLQGLICYYAPARTACPQLSYLPPHLPLPQVPAQGHILQKSSLPLGLSCVLKALGQAL